MSSLNYSLNVDRPSQSFEFISKNSKMNELLNKLKNVAPTRSTVLLSGETGVGKGFFAKKIHEHSTRANKPFIHVHCGAISENLIESELFGHEKGAFTGAIRQKLGKFELANGGTIFLDEITTLTSSAQIRLLQVLQDQFLYRVGGETLVPIDTRVIAACNDDLAQKVTDGLFRKDLFYRLNVFPLFVPPLRERSEDLKNLSLNLIFKMNQFSSKQILNISNEVLTAFENYNWPGNIRELENIIERAHILETSPIISENSVPSEIMMDHPKKAVVPLHGSLNLADARHLVIESFEKQYLIEVLNQTQGKIAKAASISGIGVRQFNKLMNKYDLHTRDFKVKN